MSTMIERVAKAIEQSFLDGKWTDGAWIGETDTDGKFGFDGAVDTKAIARDVIQALPEPASAPNAELSRFTALLRELGGARLASGEHPDKELVADVERLIAEGKEAYRETILTERRRCAAVAKDYLEDIEGCDMRDDEPELIAAAIMAEPKR